MTMEEARTRTAASHALTSVAIEKLLKAEPDSHWLLTQLGVTWYEEREYRRALELFDRSRRIVPDCPLTLWNMAGALDALGESAQAIEIYTWLIQNTRSPDEDPCWESKEWSDALKADCAFRLGVCFRHLKDWDKAEQWYREYIALMLFGIKGSYSIEQVEAQLRDRPRKDDEIRKSVRSALAGSGIRPQSGRRKAPPKLNLEFLKPVGGK